MFGGFLLGIGKTNAMILVEIETLGTVTDPRHQTHHSWTARTVPALPDEPMMPPLSLLASRIAVWPVEENVDLRELCHEYWEWITLGGHSSAEVEELTAKVVAGRVSQRDKARAVYSWVKGNLSSQSDGLISNVSPNWRTPAIDLERVLKERNPNTEQTAAFMWNMLHAAGIDAGLVLTSPVDQPAVEEKVAHLDQFSRLLLTLPDGTLLDTADRWLPFGDISWELQGRRAVWLDAESFEVRNLPESRHIDNRVRVEVTGVFGASGEVMARILWKMTGQPALALRRAVAGDANAAGREWLARKLAMTATGIELHNSRFLFLQQPDQPLEVEARYRVPGQAERTGNKLVFKLAPFMNLTSCPHLGSSARRTPVLFPYRRLEDVRVRIELPEGYILQGLPEGFRARVVDREGTISVQTLYESKDGASLTIQRRLSLNWRLLPAENVPTVQALLRRFESQRDQLLVMSDQSQL